MSADYYEDRSVKIGDWLGARQNIDQFFLKVRRLIEVDLAVGSLLYEDGQVLVFSFPGEKRDSDIQQSKFDNFAEKLQAILDDYARTAYFETPPYCKISGQSSRSLTGMTKEILKAKETMTIPLHRAWKVGYELQNGIRGHVCPVCLLRRNGSETNKQKLCSVCTKNRESRLENWPTSKGFGENKYETIWINEVADCNDRLAFVTMSLDIEPWLNGSRLDSLRAQAISEWSKNNKQLNGEVNPVDASQAYNSLWCALAKKLEGQLNNKDKLMKNLQSWFWERK